MSFDSLIYHFLTIPKILKEISLYFSAALNCKSMIMEYYFVADEFFSLPFFVNNFAMILCMYENLFRLVWTSACFYFYVNTMATCSNARLLLCGNKDVQTFFVVANWLLYSSFKRLTSCHKSFIKSLDIIIKVRPK